jgi:nucleoside-diphosphate-sugar epimerase
MLNGKAPVINLGNADVLREYVYIDDLVNAYLFLAENVERHYGGEIPRTGRATYGWAAYNVGSFVSAEGKRPEEYSNIRSVRQVIEQIGAIVGADLEPVTIPKPDNFIEIPDQFLDSGKLHDAGFMPQIDFEEGLRRTVKWYTEHQDLLSRAGARHVLSD